MNTFKFQCAFCDKKYKTEAPFLKHECDEMIRSKEIKTPAGQRAYGFYVLWNELRNYKVPNESTFITSNYYKAFQRFGKFIDNVGLPSPRDYIALMIKKGLMPVLWTDHLAYKHYVDFIDRRMAPMKQVAISAETILDICEKHDVDTGEFFDVIESAEFMQLVVRRQLSPWLLYKSKKFYVYYKDTLSTYHRNQFEGIYPMDTWVEKFADNTATAEKIKKWTVELDL